MQRNAVNNAKGITDLCLYFGDNNDFVRQLERSSTNVER